MFAGERPCVGKGTAKRKREPADSIYANKKRLNKLAELKSKKNVSSRVYDCFSCSTLAMHLLLLISVVLCE